MMASAGGNMAKRTYLEPNIQGRPGRTFSLKNPFVTWSTQPMCNLHVNIRLLILAEAITDALIGMLNAVWLQSKCNAPMRTQQSSKLLTEEGTHVRKPPPAQPVLLLPLLLLLHRIAWT